MDPGPPGPPGLPSASSFLVSSSGSSCLEEESLSRFLGWLWSRFPFVFADEDLGSAIT